MKIFLRLCLIIFMPVMLLLPVNVSAAEAFQVYYRDHVSLDGTWHIIVDPYENGYYDYRWDPFDKKENPGKGAYFTDSKPASPSDLVEYDFDNSPTLQVPGDWNTQDPKYYYYEGSIWYRKKFDAPSDNDVKRIFLYFGAVNYKAEVYLNGKKLGTHIGGFTPFIFEITGKMRPKGNSLVVKVDNKRLKEGVPTINTDWWNYGGITRSVKLVTVPETFVRDYSISLDDAARKKVVGTVHLDGVHAQEKVVLSFPELNIRQELVTSEKGWANFEFTNKKIQLWSPENPKLYRLEIATSQDTLVDSVGFRTIAARGKQILLNGKPVFLRGIAVHAEYAVNGGGRVRNAQEAGQLLDWAKELNCNFVRLAHYPHSEDMVRLAEKKGIMVWSEIPVYWTIDWTNEATYENAENQLTENILRDKNRASVIIWSLANETPVSDARNKFLQRLADKARSLDSTRLLSAAMEKHYSADDPSLAIVKDPLADMVDIVSFNEYIGWYDGLSDKCLKVSWQIPYDKPVFISEFGAGAKAGLHGDTLQRWTEEYQEEVYRNTLTMLDKIDGLSGMSPWILVDFRSPRRVLPGVQDDFNRKGIISDKGEKKKAFRF